MKIRTAALCLLACLLSVPLFALHPSAKAPLWDHLREVNAQWEMQIDDPTLYQAPIRFAREAERIQLHLQLVEHILRERTPAHLTETQRQNRLRLLDHLREYRQAGIFPRNLTLPERTPFFIDDRGTACAVGHLLIQDGEAAFAQRIHDEMNHAYIMDMPYREIDVWAQINGFTREELAWIQPGYPVQALGMAPLALPMPNDPVNFLYHDQVNDRLIVGGEFTSLGGINASGVASWNGTTFSALGGNLSGKIHAATVHNGELYLGGTFNNATHNLARLNNGSWDFSTVYTGTIYALESHNGTLYAGGDLTHTGSALVQHILRLDNSSWISVGPGFDQPVRALKSYNNKLYAGGFLQQSGSDSLAHVAAWNGQNWEAVHAGLDAPVLTFAAKDNALYAGGWIYSPQSSFNQTFGLARLGTTEWEVMIADSGYDYHSYTNEGKINRILPLGSDLYLGGKFAASNFTEFGRDVALYTPFANSLGPIAMPNPGIDMIAAYDGYLVVAGPFVSILPNSLDYLAAMALPTSREEPLGTKMALTAYPQPAGEIVRVQLPGIDLRAPEIQVLDVQGRIVSLRTEVQGEEVVIFRENLASGIYFVRISNEMGGVGVSRVVFQ